MHFWTILAAAESGPIVVEAQQLVGKHRALFSIERHPTLIVLLCWTVAKLLYKKSSVVEDRHCYLLACFFFFFCFGADAFPERMAGSKTFGVLSISIPSSRASARRRRRICRRGGGEWPSPRPPLPCCAGHANNDLTEQRVDDVVGYDNPVAEFFRGRRGSAVRDRVGGAAADDISFEI